MTTVALEFPAIAPADIPSQINYQQLTDHQLAHYSGKGDMQAFEEVYFRHHRRVYSICLRMMQNAHDAEDLAQAVFIQLYRKIGTFRGDSSFTTWLHRLTVNQVLMEFRKQNNKYGKRKLVFVDSSDIPDQPVPGTTNSNKLVVDQKISLEAAVSQLPDGYKNTFLLHTVLGFEHEEIAKILGCSVGTSKSQLHKAKLKLQKLIQKKANPKLIRT